MQLLTNQTANEDGASNNWRGGKGTFAVTGTLDGGAVKLQWSPDGGTTWFDVHTWVANTIKVVEIGIGHVRATVASGGASMDINAFLIDHGVGS